MFQAIQEVQLPLQSSFEISDITKGQEIDFETPIAGCHNELKNCVTGLQYQTQKLERLASSISLCSPSMQGDTRECS